MTEKSNKTLRQDGIDRAEGTEKSGTGALATLRKIIPFEPAAASDRLGWVGLEAARYRAALASELHPPGITCHRFVLFSRPPEELDLVYDGGHAPRTPRAPAVPSI